VSGGAGIQVLHGGDFSERLEVLVERMRQVQRTANDHTRSGTKLVFGQRRLCQQGVNAVMSQQYGTGCVVAEETP
jgi:hypothetical protein